VQDIIMAFSLQAVLAQINALPNSLPMMFQRIRLQERIEMLPLHERSRTFHDIPYNPLIDMGDDKLPQGLLSLCEQLSGHCSLAYVEAEFFGGTGTQASAFFSKGKIIGQVVVSQDAINDALRNLGVVRSVEHDEFHLVGLGRHRHTNKWMI
jgi:hypothetical protein